MDKEAFEDPCVQRATPLLRSTPLTEWLATETSQFANRARARINGWYSKFPDSERRMLQKLRSTKDTEVLQALDELFVHSLLAQRWPIVLVEVGETTKPDFMCCSEDGSIACVVEVASLFEPELWMRDRLLYDEFADLINSDVPVEHGYCIGLQFDDTARIPPARRFKSWLRRILAELPPPASVVDGLLERRFEDPDGGVLTRFIPLKGERSHPDMLIVGMGPIIGGSIGTITRLRDRVDQKLPSKYKLADGIPFLVAIGLHDFMGERESGLWACYGTQTLLLDTGSMTNSGDGLFGVDNRNKKGKRTRLSAIATIQNFHIWREELPVVDVLHNPLAETPWLHDFLPATRQFGRVGETGSSIQLGWL